MTDPSSVGITSEAALARIDQWLQETFSPADQLGYIEWLTSRGTQATAATRWFHEQGLQVEWATVNAWQKKQARLGDVAAQVNEMTGGGAGVDAKAALEDMLARMYLVFGKSQEKLFASINDPESKELPTNVRGLAEFAKECRSLAEYMDSRQSEAQTSQLVLDGAYSLFDRLLAAAKETDQNLVVEWLNATGLAVLTQVRGELGAR